MCSACWIPKATNTLSQYVIYFCYQLQTIVARTLFQITSCVSLHFLFCHTMSQACQSSQHHTKPKVFKVRSLNVITWINTKTLFYWIILRHSYRITKWCQYFQQNGSLLPFHTNARTFTDAVVLAMNCKALAFPHLTRLDLSLCGFIKNVIYVPPIRTALHETAAGHHSGGNDGEPEQSVVNTVIIGISLGHLQGKQGSSCRTAVDSTMNIPMGCKRPSTVFFEFTCSSTWPPRASTCSLMWTPHSHTHTPHKPHYNLFVLNVAIILMLWAISVRHWVQGISSFDSWTDCSEHLSARRVSEPRQLNYPVIRFTFRPNAQIKHCALSMTSPHVHRTNGGNLFII